MKKLLFIILILFASNALASSLPNCPSDQSKRYHNCFGTINFNNGDKYVGEWKDNKSHGQGTFTWGKDTEWAGEKYVGEFKDNKRHGQGTYTYANGDKYVGEFKDGKCHGQGTYTFGINSEWAGDKYVGEHKDNEFHGQGTYTYASGDKYVGEWKDGDQYGQGIYTYPDGREERGYHMNDEYVPTICENMGLKKGTESFGQCVVSLINEINKDD